MCMGKGTILQVFDREGALDVVVAGLGLRSRLTTARWPAPTSAVVCERLCTRALGLAAARTASTKAKEIVAKPLATILPWS